MIFNPLMSLFLTASLTTHTNILFHLKHSILNSLPHEKIIVFTLVSEILHLVLIIFPFFLFSWHPIAVNTFMFLDLYLQYLSCISLPFDICMCI